MQDRVALPLGQPPRIVRAMCSALHGVVEVERYRLDGFCCLNLFEGHGVVSIDGRAHRIRPGYAGITRPDEDIEYRYEGKALLAFVHFVPARGAEPAFVPVMQDLGTSFASVRAGIAEIAQLHPVYPAQAAATFWHLLWGLVARDAPHDDRATLHPALRKAIELTTRDLSKWITAARIAKHVGLSQTHLNRLFATAFGMTVTGYVRDQRMLLARHLLEHSDLPIKQIACQVGLPDPHHFNKTVRRAFGRSPSQLRTPRVTA
jgi:AraC family transcriptional regulator